MIANTLSETEPPKSPMLRRSWNQHNANAARHGLRGQGVPRGCTGVTKSINHFRRQLEQAVVNAHGEITLVHACLINTAYRYERHAQLAQRWLLVAYDDLSHADRLNYSREAARASAERDKAIMALNLNRPADDLWNGTIELPTNNHSTNGHSDNGCDAAGDHAKPPESRNAAAAALDGHDGGGLGSGAVTADGKAPEAMASDSSDAGGEASVASGAIEVNDQRTGDDKQPGDDGRFDDDGQPNRWGSHRRLAAGTGVDTAAPGLDDAQCPVAGPMAENGVDHPKTIAQDAPGITPTGRVDG
jgi:hypothetical protein